MKLIFESRNIGRFRTSLTLDLRNYLFRANAEEYRKILFRKKNLIEHDGSNDKLELRNSNSLKSGFLF